MISIYAGNKEIIEKLCFFVKDETFFTFPTYNIRERRKNKKIFFIIMEI